MSMNIYNTITETSGSSNYSVLPLKKRKITETSDLSNYSVLPLKKRKRRLHDDATNSKYKGVVKQQNGHWGAQIYIDLKRIWIGTFKSAVEAASAYDSASLKLGKYDANSFSDYNVHEQEFQEDYTTEAVLNMIKDGSYPYKFREYCKKRSHIATSINNVGSKQSGKDVKSTLKLLFQKELTVSDVGKLNRLVIPKKYAVTYLPCIRHDRSKREEGEIREDMDEVEVVFYDRAMRQWTFRYCYWTSSQSYVFTRGWNCFVKEKKLKEKDIIVFYTCDDLSNVDCQTKNFLMIDVQYLSQTNSLLPKEVNKIANESSDTTEVKTKNVVISKLDDKETKSEEKKRGFMLFGVRIQ